MAQQMSETPVLDLLAGMTALSLETSTLDAQGIMLARIAALVATDVPPISYALNLGAAGQGGVGAGEIPRGGGGGGRFFLPVVGGGGLVVRAAPRWGAGCSRGGGVGGP